MCTFCVPFLSSTPLSSSSTSFFPSFNYPDGINIQPVRDFLTNNFYSHCFIHLSASPTLNQGPLLPYHIRYVWYFSVQLPLSRTEYEGFSFSPTASPLCPRYQFLANISPQWRIEGSLMLHRIRGFIPIFLIFYLSHLLISSVQLFSFLEWLETLWSILYPVDLDPSFQWQERGDGHFDYTM